MLRKVELRIMEPPTSPAQVAHELRTFEIRCKEAAFALYTLSHLSIGKKKSKNNLVMTEELLAISALLPALRDLLTGPMYSTPDTPILSDNQIEILAKSVLKCGPVLDKIAKVVDQVGNLLGTFDHGKEEEKKEFTVYPGSEKEAREILRPCFRNMMVAMTAARAEHLSRKAYLSPDEFGEQFRLSDALKHPSYNEIPDLAISEYLAQPARVNFAELARPLNFSSDRPPSPPPQQRQDVIELQLPKGFRGRYGHPDYPLLDKQLYVQLYPVLPEVVFDKSFEEEEVERHRLSAEGKYPDVASFGNWPPSFIASNSIQDYQLKGIMSGKGKKKEDQLPPLPPSSARSVVATPNSTRASTPDTESDKETVVGVGEPSGTQPRPDSASKDESGGSPPKTIPETSEDRKEDVVPTIEPTGESMEKPVMEGTTGKQAAATTHSAERAAPPCPKDTPHLEACILRPLCDDVYSVIEWSYKIEQLPLDDEEIQSHVHKLGPEHSVIDDIRELHPEQYRLIKIRAKNRDGTLVSAQHGKPVDMVTKMGTFQVQPVVFVLKTSKVSEKETETEKYDTHGNLMHPPPPPLFGNRAPTSSAFGGFGNNLAPTSGLGNGFGHTSSAFGGFGSSATQPTSGVFGVKDQNTRAREYRQKLEENGEVCTHVEPKPGAISNLFGGFGQSQQQQQQQQQPGGLFAAARAQTDSGPGLFGKPASTAASSSIFGQPITPHGRGGLFGGLFGGGSSGFGGSGSGGGLFGASTQNTSAPSRSHFGTAPPSSGGGLFGNPGTSNDGRQPGWPSQLHPLTSSGQHPSALAPGWPGSSQLATPSLGLFGTVPSAPRSSSNSFGTAPPPASTQSTGLFGGPPAASGGLLGTAQPAASTQSRGLFGSNPQPAPSSGLFGSAQSAPSAGPFESMQPAASTQSQGLFGSTQPSAPSPSLLRNTTTSTALAGPFGTAPPSSSTRSGGLFGKPTTSGGPFGTSQQSAPSPGLFSKAPSGPAPSLFGPTPPTSSPSLFGRAQPTPSPPSTGLFGSTQPACPSLFSSILGTAPYATSSSGGGLFSATSQANNNHGGTPHGISATTATSTAPANTPAVAANTSLALGLGPATAALADTIPTPKYCKTCTAILQLHTPSELSAGLCDACAIDKTTTCFVCKAVLFGTASICSNPNSLSQPSSKTPQTSSPAFAVAPPPIVPLNGNRFSYSATNCKTCGASLAFHNAEEKAAKVCDKCAESKETECSMCQFRAKKEEKEGKEKPEASDPKKRQS